MEENCLDMEDILGYITAYASESEYLIHNVLATLTLYEEGIWYFDTVYADQEENVLLYVFTDDAEEEVIKVKAEVFLDRQLMDALLQEFVTGYAKGYCFSLGVH